MSEPGFRIGVIKDEHLMGDLEMTQNFRAEAITNALQAYRANGSTRTETIEYRGVSRNLEVVTISPEVPLLNPGNSRLRAQLLEHPQYPLVATNPTSPEAQKILAGLLSSTEKFPSLGYHPFPMVNFLHHVQASFYPLNACYLCAYDFFQ